MNDEKLKLEELNEKPLTAVAMSGFLLIRAQTVDRRIMTRIYSLMNFFVRITFPFFTLTR
jgi:hypothetical protein